MRLRRLSTATIVALCGLAALGGCGGVSQASAAPLRGPLLPRIADALAATIRHDARERPTHPTAVKTLRSGGLRTLAVYYRAKPGNRPPYGGYELLVTTAHGALREVAVTEEVTGAPYVPDTVPGEYSAIDFRIAGPSGASTSWGAMFGTKESGCSAPREGFPPSCMGLASAHFLDEHSRTRLMAFFAEAVTVIKRAERHAPMPHLGG